MTGARSEVFKKDEIGFYHCISRCVRRAYLCGYDELTGASFEHRRSWIRDRLSGLSKVFCIEIAAYAIMANHLHTLIRNRPDIGAKLSPKDVAKRWLRLFPLRWVNGRPAEPNEFEIYTITSDPGQVEIYRERLCCISWLNRCLCEHIARRANAEDKCTGRFWEGRFKSQRVHDLSGFLACSVYIDLNPIRAGVSSTPEDSDYTSVQDRIRTLKRTPLQHQDLPVVSPYPPLISIEEATNNQITTKEYLSLVDATGRVVVDGKGSIPSNLEEILVRLNIKPKSWLDTTTNYRHRFRRMVGPARALIEAAEKAGKCWFHGINAARAAFV
jgi:REP element-mobilizing transposase RayT